MKRARRAARTPLTIGALWLGLAVLSTACSNFPRQLRYGTIESRAMHNTMDYAVYTPPGWHTGERLPLVVFLHGGGDDVLSFDRWGLSQMLDQAIAAGEVPRVIIALPEGNLGFWMNWYDRSRLYEDWVLNEMLPEVQQRYRTKACPEDCHVMGVSMGGAGSLRFALHRPELFRSVTALSAPVFNTEMMASFAGNRLYRIFMPTHRIFGPANNPQVIAHEDLYRRWRSQADLRGMRLFLGWAIDDRAEIVLSSERFHRHLESRNIAHEAMAFPGNHSWRAWNPVILEALSRMVPGNQLRN